MFAAVLPLLVVGALARAENATAGWTRKCPPNGYGQPQPAFDTDVDGDGTNDGWDVPITIQEGANTYPATDAKGNKVSLVCIPHSADNPGGPNGRYSPRFKKAGGTGKGAEVGRCVFPCGRNNWALCFKDAGGDGTQDCFTNSEWASLEHTDSDSDGTWDEFTKKGRRFIADLTKDKIVPTETDKPREEDQPAFAITDATIVDLGTDLSQVVLNGTPIDFPGGAAPMVQ